MSKKTTLPTLFICAATAFVTSVIYFFSLCPTIYLIDSGELAAVSYTLGIAHPTGYPLYTLISYFFAHLPGEPIRNLNILSSLITVTAAIFVYLTAKGILKDKFTPIVCASLFAFSPTIWRTSITNEVYPLTALLAILIIYAFHRLGSIKILYVVMYLIGLAFTNHIIIFSLALPIFLYTVIVYRPPFKKLVNAILFAILGGSLYFYLITRTIGGAELAWGNTYNLQRLLWHITGRQYQVWMFSLPISEILSNLVKGLNLILRNFLYILIIPVIIGFFQLFKTARGKFWLFFLIFILNLLYTINYSIPDIESYYIPGFISLIFVFVYGVKSIMKHIKWFIAIPLALIIPILNYHSCTLRHNTFGYDFSRLHIEQLPQKSLLMCAYWDIYSPTIYMRKIESIRNDLIIIDKELLRRTWYIRHLKDEYPEFYETVSQSVEDYLIELYKFEYDKPYHTPTIQMKFIRMLENFVDSKMSEGVYLAMPFPDFDFDQIKPGYLRIPRGLVFEVKKDTTGFIPFDFSHLDIEKPEMINDERLKFNLEVVKSMINNNIRYLSSARRIREAETAKKWLDNF
jgi:hypothetical protein